ncbi:MAG: hypothetical protein H5T96_06940 [Tissierellales bacterium]|nr:hypothetical protein [Tissierellales bacterium]
MDTIITIVITLIVFVIWQKFAESKNKLSLRVLIKGLMNELDQLSKLAGYDGIEDYWDKEKGEDYKKVAMMNYINALKSLE